MVKILGKKLFFKTTFAITGNFFRIMENTHLSQFAMNSVNNICDFNHNKNVPPFRWSLRFTFQKLFQGAKFWFCFFSLITADWLRTPGCLHGRALDTVICVALYQGLQIFAGRFGGKCLGQCKHCRPQRNPGGSEDHSRTPALSYCPYKGTISESLSDRMSPLKRPIWVQVMRVSWFSHRWIRSFLLCERYGGKPLTSQSGKLSTSPPSAGPLTCWATLASHWPSLGSDFLDSKRRWLNKMISKIPFFEPIYKGFPAASDSKESASNAGDWGSIRGWGRSPGEGNGNPLQYSCLENSMDGGAWRATVHRVTEADGT